MVAKLILKYDKILPLFGSNWLSESMLTYNQLNS